MAQYLGVSLSDASGHLRRLTLWAVRVDHVDEFEVG